MLTRLIVRFRGLVRRRAATAEIDEELQFHLAHEIEANVARGMPEREARRVALRDLGGLSQATEAVRDVRASWMEGLWRDVRHSVRALRASPSFTVVALSVLGLSVGVCVAVFSVVDAVVLRALPFDRADRLVAVGEQVKGDQDAASPNLVAPQNFLDWRARQHVFTDLAAIGYAEISVKGADEVFPENIPARVVTASFFEVLHARPLIGRPFTAANEVAGRQHVAVISYALWQRRFGGRSDVIGQRLPGLLASFEILGVMPPTFSYPVGAAERVGVWVPYVVPAEDRVRGHEYGYNLQVIGRLRDGVSIQQAQANMDQITAALAAETPRWFEDRTAKVERLRTYFTRGVGTWMLMLLGAVVCVLLIACVNLANLMLARATSRRQELAVRAALGASYGSLARALFVESVLLSVGGAGLGALLASTTLGLLRAALPHDLPRLAMIAIDMRVLALTMGAAIALGLALGMAPVLQFARPAAAGRLTHAQRTATGDRRTAWLRAALIVTEVALAMMLLVGAALFLTSFRRVANIDLGFDYHDVLTVHFRPMVLPNAIDPGQQPLLALLERARALPGVEAAALTTNGVPLRGDLYTQDFSIPGSPGPRQGDIALNAVSPDYFAALRIPIREGRGFSDADRQGGQPVVIVNARAAQQFFGGDAAIGRVMQWRGALGARTIVGIVGNIRYDGPENDARPQAFVPFAQTTKSAATLLVRVARGAPDALNGIRAAFAAAYGDGAMAPVNVQVETLEHYLRDLVAQRRFNMWLFGVFGLLGIGIACIGIYGVMAYLVAQRTQEIGIRMALGARPSTIFRSVLGGAARHLAIGLIAGVIGAWMLSATVKGLLFGIQPHDATVYVLVGGLLAVVALLAAFIPARRAANVDPLVALRIEV